MTFNPGESKKELSIKTVNDDVNEGTETFRIELVVDLSKLNETYICIDVNVGSLLVNITDDDDGECIWYLFVSYACGLENLP